MYNIYGYIVDISELESYMYEAITMKFHETNP